MDWGRIEQAFLRELQHFLQRVDTRNTRVESVYFGGGTPSLSRPVMMERVLQTLEPYLSPQAEITLEANPNERSKFQGFRGAGVNRLSLGVQSLTDRNLQQLGRLHTAAETVAAIEHARTVFPKVSMDMMYGLPGQTVRQWEADLQKAMPLADNHMSVYQLTIERGTPFHERYRSTTALHKEDTVVEMEQVTRQQMDASGFERYEVSSYARQGASSVHNTGYWLGNDYLGIGPGAHGRFTATADGRPVLLRLVQEPVPERWLASVEQYGGQSLAAGEFPASRSVQILRREAMLEELVVLGLRHRFHGVSQERVEQRLPGSQLSDVLDMDVVKQLAADGWLETTVDGGTTVRCTDRGLDVLDTILAKILQPASNAQ